jgi:redox-sensitive bicupin YhaK (pirin superfamily)
MNAGKGCWQEEGTRPDDPTFHGLQIFVCPHTVDLQPNIQFREIGSPGLNEWRLLAGPENTEALSFVRNDVQLYTMPTLCAAPKSIYRSAKAGMPSSIPIAAELMSTGQASKRKRVHSW